LPRYFLVIRNDKGLIEDPDGSVLASLGEAEAEAIDCMRELVASSIVSDTEAPVAIEICDSEGNTLSEVSVLDALPSSLRRHVVRSVH